MISLKQFTFFARKSNHPETFEQTKVDPRETRRKELEELVKLRYFQIMNILISLFHPFLFRASGQEFVVESVPQLAAALDLAKQAPPAVKQSQPAVKKTAKIKDSLKVTAEASKITKLDPPSEKKIGQSNVAKMVGSMLKRDKSSERGESKPDVQSEDKSAERKSRKTSSESKVHNIYIRLYQKQQDLNLNSKFMQLLY